MNNFFKALLFLAIAMYCIHILTAGVDNIVSLNM